MATPRDQPSKVVTEDVIKPSDEHVVTSDTPQEVIDSRAPDPGKKTAAAAGDKPGSNDPNSAPGDKKYSRKQVKRGDRRFDKLTLRLDAADSTNQELRGRVDTLETENEALKAATPKVAEPKFEDFKDAKEYAKAYSKWEQAAKAAPKPTAKKPASPPPPPPPAPAGDAKIEQFRKLGVKVIGDAFVTALQDKDNAVNATMGDFMLDSDAGPEIYVHLSKNKKDARKIFDSKPAEAKKALEALEVKALAGELDVPEGGLDIEDPGNAGDPDNDPKKTPKSKRPGDTKAPDPPSDTKPGNAKPDKAPEDMDMDEYKVYRDKQERSRMGLPP